MNAHPALAGRVLTIDEVDALHDGVDRRTRELIAEYVDADLLVFGVVSSNRLDDAFDRARIRERVPGAQAFDYRAALLRRVGDPLAAISRKHVRTLVVHHLETFHLRIDVQSFLHLFDHHRPDIVEHAAGRVD